ncbi:hypothetical protein LOK74_19105 [Brevibacillus humidisoli]|uniref:hypothetical protein n=1 Tax=Brevibacillus humidisoli TaxID=2895522 RepID=UPI001E43792D|nr:hypothetical protein [Brevibacillus humidisoli]UFJ40123.1 hypothetical protein LOK74_19105 [Brevibacillus humidisoli]
MNYFLGTFVFLLPGLMAYFWLQVFGLTPPVKHTTSEVAGISALLWLPISFTSLCLLNLWSLMGEYVPLLAVKRVWTVDELMQATGDIRYLLLFVAVSAWVSFGLCVVWSTFLASRLEKLINKVRYRRGLADLSSRSTVWDEIFSTQEPQVVEISKLDKPEEKQIGSIIHVSRPFEPERVLVLDGIRLWTQVVAKYRPEPEKVFVDIKAGIAIKVFNSDVMLEHALRELNTTSSDFVTVAERSS